jgi:4-amino-4-deoxy-L-arabinose transferase-like glycosyltransferase
MPQPGETGVRSDDHSSLRSWVIAWTCRAFLARLAPLVLPFEWSGPDSVSYLTPAQDVLAGEGYTATHRPPGYPAFLIIGLGLGGGSLLVVRLLQALLGALTVPLVHGLLRSRHGARAAKIGVILAALDPIAVGQSPFLLREGLLLFLLTLLLWILSRWQGRRRYVGAGGVLAALTLTHPLFVLLGPALLAVEVATEPSWGARLRRARPWVGALLIVALPTFLWGRRNQHRSGQFGLGEIATTVPARELWLTSACSNLWVSGDTATGFQALAWQREAQLVDELGVAGAKRELYRMAWANWRDHPLRSAGRVVRQNTWYWLEIPGAVRLVHHDRLYLARWLLLPWHWVRLCCALAGIHALLKSGRWRTERATLGTVLFFVVAPAMLYPIPRYLAPAIPVLDLLAAIGLERAWRRRERRA